MAIPASNPATKAIAVDTKVFTLDQRFKKNVNFNHTHVNCSQISSEQITIHPNKMARYKPNAFCSALYISTTGPLLSSIIINGTPAINYILQSMAYYPFAVEEVSFTNNTSRDQQVFILEAIYDNTGGVTPPGYTNPEGSNTTNNIPPNQEEWTSNQW